ASKGVGAKTEASKDAASKSAPKKGDDHSSDEDKGPIGPPASYAINITAALDSAWHVGDKSAVYLSLAVTNTKPGPRQPPKKDAKEGDDTKAADKKPADKSKTPPKPTPKPKT